MLHEEVDLRWEELLIWIQDFQFLEKLRPELVVGVSILYIWPFHKLFSADEALIIFPFYTRLGHHNIHWNSSSQSRGTPKSHVLQRNRIMASRCFDQRERLDLAKFGLWESSCLFSFVDEQIIGNVRWNPIFLPPRHYFRWTKM